jgi:hypothetical protein
MSAAEDLLAVQLDRADIPFVREVRFAPEEWCFEHGFVTPVRKFPRSWRADFLVAPKLLVEVEGGSWAGGRHVRGAGFEADCEKYAAAAILGYRMIRATTAQVEDNRALEWIRAAIEWRAA